MELLLTNDIDWWAHITPISQYPTTRIPFQHGTPQPTIDLMGRVTLVYDLIKRLY